MTDLVVLPALKQGDLGTEPHDRWLAPGGRASAEFYRTPDGYLVRFPDQADFEIDLALDSVACTPVSDAMQATAQSLFHNAIEPLLGNFAGGLYLHGSAVSIDGQRAIAFLGDSRRGKTTLAGAFAQAGYPFLSEDTVKLTFTDGQYFLQPSRPVLRLFQDSAAFLLGEAPNWQNEDAKNELAAGRSLPFTDRPNPLCMICLLGPGESKTVCFEPISKVEALSQLFRHAFVLDVEDRARLRAHFGRLGELVEHVPCLTLDYPRTFAQLPEVIGAVVQRAARGA